MTSALDKSDSIEQNAKTGAPKTGTVGNAINGVRVTRMEAEVYAALTDAPEHSGVIARLANIHTSSRGETAAKFCISLTKKGLAVKSGTRMFPKWSRSPLPAPPLIQGERL